MKLSLSFNRITELALAHIKSSGFRFDPASPDELKITPTSDPAAPLLEISGVRIARKSFGESSYECKFEWPLNCMVQCGGDGMVIEDAAVTLKDALTKPEVAVNVLAGNVRSRRTAFFEAFPRSPDTFLRGEGGTIEEAEQNCWKSYQKILNCSAHEFERRDRTDGYCFCKHCGLSGLLMQPLHPCFGCKATEYKQWSFDKSGNSYCRTCFEALPVECLTESSLRCRELRLGIQKSLLSRDQ